MAHACGVRLASLALVAVAAIVGGSAGARTAELKHIWIGTFDPQLDPKTNLPCLECKGPKVTPQAGVVRVLTPSDGSPPATGDVVMVSPLLGVVARGRLEAGRVAVAWFNYDHRESDDGVLVLPASVEPILVEPTAA